MGPLAALGMQAAGQAVGAGMGLIAGGINDARQVKQQKKLQQMQIDGQKQMMNYSMEKQMEMWKNTSYPAQVEMMNKAGINPALMYGMGGGGGTTTGSPSGNVSGATASQNPGELQQFMGMGMQMQLMQAQKEVLQSQANLNNVEANKKAGVDTEKVTQEIENLFQGLQNLKQDWEMKKLDITMKNMENFEKQASQADRLKSINYDAKSAVELYKSLAAKASIDEATINEKIKIIKQEAIAAVLKNSLTTEQIANTKQDFKLQAQKLMIEWDKLSLDSRKQMLNEIKIGDDDNTINDAIDRIIKLF